MQPILLRSAAVVGLAAAVAAFVSHDAFFARPAERPHQEAIVLVVQEEPDDAGSAPAAVEVPKLAGAPVSRPAALASDAPDSAQLVASLPEATPEMSTDVNAATDLPAPALIAPAAAEPAIAPAVVRPAAAMAPAESVAPPVPLPVARAAMEPPQDAIGESIAEPATVGSLPMADCPRDWVNVEGQPSGRTAFCEKLAALMPSDGDPAEQRLLEQAASERASQIAALQFVPRIPQARPDPPPRPRKTTVRKARWPAGSPPNCGNKHAYWRYVSNVPTWYCK